MERAHQKEKIFLENRLCFLDVLGDSLRFSFSLVWSFAETWELKIYLEKFDKWRYDIVKKKRGTQEERDENRVCVFSNGYDGHGLFW